jgi:glutamate dehydrogenase/leucine dehydrogenase
VNLLVGVCPPLYFDQLDFHHWIQIADIYLRIQNNAHEGALIPPSDIRTENDTIAWIKSYFVNLSGRDITDILKTYPTNSGSRNASTARYETSGYGPVTALDVSPVATGQQQRVYVSPPSFFSEYRRT